MNFGRAHKVTTYLAVWCAYLTLLLSSEMSLPATALSLVGIVGSWWWEAPRVQVERWQKWWSVVGVLVFGWSVLSWLGGDDLVLAGSELIRQSENVAALRRSLPEGICRTAAVATAGSLETQVLSVS